MGGYFSMNTNIPPHPTPVEVQLFFIPCSDGLVFNSL